MKNLQHWFILWVFLLTFPVLNFAQQLPASFQARLDQMALTIAIPLEQSYREKRIRNNEFLRADYAIRSKKKRIEIQYALFPQSKNAFCAPQVHSTATVTSLASNEEHASTIAVHSISDDQLVNGFNADWGSIAFFQPKRSFSKYQYAKLISLYKLGKGMVYVLLLFDQPNDVLEERYYGARFGGIEN